MTEQSKTQSIPHNVYMNNCEKLSLTGITDVGSFDENCINCFVDSGELIIKGYGLHVDNINTVSGDMEITGKITSLLYTDCEKRSSFFSKLFK